jgi:hypothetical protein
MIDVEGCTNQVEREGGQQKNRPSFSSDTMYDNRIGEIRIGEMIDFIIEPSGRIITTKI